MRVLYIGNYKDGTGWGNAALNNILAMHYAGIDVIPRAVHYNSNNIPHEIVNKLEQQTSKQIDICIQHVLPNAYYYDSSFKNIGIYFVETENFKYSLWQKYINLLDEAWVCNTSAIHASNRSGVSIPIKAFKASIDFDKFNNLKPTASVAELKNGFNFCFFGELVHRKNLEDLIKAFHLEFHPSEDVNLFFKISHPSLSHPECLKIVQELNKHVQQKLKIRKKYKEILAISGRLKNEDYISVMAQCHCMVVASHGEACCIPVIEAQALGLRVIYTGGTGMDDYVSQSVNYKIDSVDSECYGANDSLEEIYSSYETWKNINIEELRKAMRHAYEQYKNGTDVSQQCKDFAAKFDIKKVGHEIREMLECQ